MFQQSVSIYHCHGHVCTAYAHKLLFPSLGQYPDTGVGLGDSDFIYGTDVLAIDGHLQCHIEL